MYLHRPLCADCDKIPKGRTSIWTYVFLQGRQWETFRGRTWNRNQPDPVRGPPVHQNLPFLQVKFSVGDPSHFRTDPDPRIHTIPDPDPAIFVSDLQGWQLKKLIFLLSFFVYYFLRLHLHNFSKIKSHKEVPKQEEWRFSLLFLLDDRRSRIRIREAHSIRIRIRCEVLTAEVLWIRVHLEKPVFSSPPSRLCRHKNHQNLLLPFIAVRGSQRDVVYLGRPIAPSYMTQMGGVAGSQRMSTGVHMEPKKTLEI